MANTSFVNSKLAPFAGAQKSALTSIFDYILKDIRFGRCDPGGGITNIAVYGFEGRTHATPDTEFSIEHGMKVTPRLLIPALSLGTVNQELVPLKVTREADAERIYLSSSVADAPIRVLVEF